MKKYFLLLALSFFAVACNTEENNTDNNDGKEIPLEPGNSGNKTNKPKAIWIDAHANFSRFATKSAITSYMEKIKDTGFNEIYLDVKPRVSVMRYTIVIFCLNWKNGEQKLLPGIGITLAFGLKKRNVWILM